MLSLMCSPTNLLFPNCSPIIAIYFFIPTCLITITSSSSDLDSCLLLPALTLSDS